MIAVHRLTHLLLSLAAAALFSGQSLAQGAQPASAASAPLQAGEGDAVQRVLRDLARGQNARPAIQALKDPAPAGPSTGRAQEARQFDAAQQQLIEALRAYLAQRGSLEALRAHYDAWRAAAQIVQVQMDSQGERLQQSADGAAYVGKHAQARSRVSAALAQVQGLLDPMLVGGGTASAKSASQPLAPTGSRQSAEDALAALQKLQTRHRETPILRAQPVPFGGLNLAPRQPVSTPTVLPSYETAGEVTPMPADRDGSAHAPLDEEILARAKALDNDYVRIYEFVRNQTRNEWYAGSVKGALGVLRSGAGNDVDQASLLTALLRAAGLNTRYVQGVVEVPLERLAAELGVPAGDVNAVPLALGKAGVAFNPVVRGGRVAAVQLARTWVSAYVPYTNYRGALVDASGKSWIPLDPYYKSYQYQASPGFFGRSFSAAGLSREFLARTQTGTFADFLRTRLGNALATAGTAGPAGTWQGQRGVAQSDTLQLDILPNSLPYAVAAVTREGADLPSTELATVRIRLQQGARADDAVVLDKTLPLAAVGNARLTLSYGPASLEDHRVALLYGGMDGVPLYLIGLRGQLKLGGELVGTATDKVDPGASLRLTLTLKGPWGEQEVEQTVMAGAHHALLIGNDPQRPATTAASDSDHQGVKLLDGLGLYYTRQWNEADRDIAGWLDAGLVRPLPAVTLVSTTLRPAYVAGVPVTLEWTGVSLDAALRPVDGVGAGAPDALTLSALAGSSLEQGVFRDQFSVEAMSADRGVQLARGRGLAVLELDGGNLAQIDTTDHADNVKQAVRDLVGQGFALRIPAATLTQQAWSGSVWQAWQGTRAGFFLSGGLAGGTSVEAPEVWTLGFLADVFRSMETEEANKDPRSGVRVVALGASSGQRGVAGEALPVPYTVLVTDKLGRPVKNAQVSFSVITGDAKVGGGGSTTVPTNVIGMASVPVTLGQSTGINPVWIMRNEGDEAATRVGAISVDVQVDSAIGPLRPDEPMSALLLPGPLSALNSKSEVPDTGLPAATVGVLSLGTEDQYGNPVANVQVNFSISGQAQSSCATGPGGKYRQGALWNAFASANACPGGAVLGQCGQASLQLKSVSNGVVYAGVILSNEIKGSNTVTANAGGVSRTFNFTNTGYCEPFADRAVYYGMLSTQGGESDGEGNPVAATAPGTTYGGTFQVAFMRTEWAYYFDANGKVRFDPYANWVPASGSLGNIDVSNGGSASAGGQSFRINTAGAPARHDATVNATVTVTGIQNTPRGPENFSSDVSVSGRGGTVFGVRPVISSIGSRDAGTADPNKIHLDAGGVSMFPIDIKYTVEPPDYKSMPTGWVAKLLMDGQLINYAAGDSRIKQGTATLPRSQVFEPRKHNYEAQLNSTLTYGKLESEKFRLPLRQKLLAGVSAAGASRYVDVVNKRVCDVRGNVAFALTQDAVAKVTYQRLGAGGEPLGRPVDLSSEKDYPAGVSEVEIDAGKLGDGKFEFAVQARAKADPSITDEDASRAGVTFKMSNNLPVGQTLVRGVNVRSGILTHQTLPLNLAGRGNVFNLVLSYSSSGSGEISTVGANWGHNHDMGLFINSCGEVSVNAGDSGSVRFFPKPDGTMTPDKGYHGTLVANRTDNTWNYYSKDGTQYHYKFITQRVQWKLMWVRDRNGNTLTYDYDLNAFPEPVLKAVTHSDGRKLSFSYTSKMVPQPAAGTSQRNMLTEVKGSGDQFVKIDYDDLGNMVSHSVNGRSTNYAYTIDAPNPWDRYRLSSATDAKSDVTSYIYGVHPVNVNTPDGIVAFTHPWVSDVTTNLGGTMRLSIDQLAWSRSKLTQNPGGTTEYTFNAYGSPLTVADDAGTTTMTWAEDDVVMLSKRDARGVTTTYDYDTEGNVKSETVDGKSSKYTYEIQSSAPFSKSRMTGKEDRNGNRFGFVLDGAGNVVRETLPIGSLTHTYSGTGDRLSSTDANGNTTRFEYDSVGNLSATRSAVGARLESNRDARGRVVSSTDGKGNRSTYTYDGQDNLVSQINPEDGTRTMTYDGMGNKLSEKDEGGRTTNYIYGKGSLVTGLQFTGPGGGASRSFSYDGAGNKLTETDWNGATTSYGYDAVHRVTSRTEPLGKTTSYAYDGVGNLTSETTAGRGTSHRYDTLGRRSSTTDAEGQSWAYEYDGNGNRTSATDPLSRRTGMRYDGMDRLVEVTQPLGRTTAYEYDPGGNKIAEIDPLGNRTSFRYDAANRLVAILRPDSTAVGLEYDLANNLTRQTDEGGGVTQFGYDAMNRKTSARDPEGGTHGYGYDRLGNLTSETWPNGNALSHGYDLFNRRVSSTDSLGRLGSWRYDNNGNLLSEVDGNGNTSTHEYNALNLRTSSALPGGRTLGYKPDLFGNVEELTDARGNKSFASYDKLNRVTRSTHADGGVVESGYDAAGNKTLQTDPRGFATIFTYDELNRVKTVKDPLGQVTSSDYDKANNLVHQTDKRGTATQYRYDVLSRRVSTTKAGLELEALSYTALGKVASSTDANGHVTRFAYDRRGLLTSTAAPEGATTRQQLDSMGDVVQSIDAEGRVSKTGYDKRRRAELVSNPAGEATGFEYDLNNNRVAQQRPLGGRSLFEYDASNWLVSVTEPASRKTRYERDKNGNLTKVSDGEGRAVSFGYDTMDRRSSITQAGGAAQSFEFDKAGNPTLHVDANGVAVTRSFDKISRETLKTFSASSDGLTGIATGYDANGNPLTITESYASGQARVTTHEYDAFDRPTSSQDGYGAKMVFSYDKNGNRTTLATQDAKQTRYGYDGLNRLTGLNSPAGGVQYVYDRSGLTLQQIWSNGTATESRYDAARRPLRITLSKGSTALNLTEYLYDKNGNRLEERVNRPHAANGAQLTTYRYDAADRLEGTTLRRGADGVETTWSYDRADNRLSEKVVSRGATNSTVERSYSYDARNQLRSIADSAAGTTTLSYDAQGNLTQKAKGGDTTTYAWNARDLLSNVSRNGTVLGNYSSDHAGLRVSKEAMNPLQPGAPPRLLRTQWDEQNALQDRDAAGTVLMRYDFAQGQPVALWSAEDGQQLLHADALGSIVATTAADGSLKSETLYDAWGNPIERQGQSANKFAYTGHQADPETGLYYFKARYYDPELGRFISEDPADGQDGKPASYHRYLYAYGNPLVYIDPDGRVALLKDGADTLGDFSGWLRGRAEMCSDGALCKVAAGAIGVSRAVVGLGEVGLRAGNVLANTASLALGTLGLNSEDNVNAHAAELEGTVNATKAAFDAVTTKAGRQRIADKATSTLDKALAGDSGAISDVTEFAAGFVGGGAAVKQGANVASTASSVVRQVERVAAREAMAGTATAAKAGVEVAEATVVKQTGRLTTEAVAGPGVEVAAGKTVKSVAAEASSEVRSHIAEGAGRSSVHPEGKVASNDRLAQPGRLQAKLDSWREYKADQANAGWKLDRWSSQYDILQANRINGKNLESIYERLGLGSPGRGLNTPIGKRIPDVQDGRVLREIKSGDVSFDKFTRKQMYKDFWLKQNGGYAPEWHFHGNVTPRVLQKLETYEIPYVVH